MDDLFSEFQNNLEEFQHEILQNFSLLNNSIAPVGDFKLDWWENVGVTEDVSLIFNSFQSQLNSNFPSINEAAELERALRESLARSMESAFAQVADPHVHTPKSCYNLGDLYKVAKTSTTEMQRRLDDFYISCKRRRVENQHSMLDDMEKSLSKTREKTVTRCMKPSDERSGHSSKSRVRRLTLPQKNKVPKDIDSVMGGVLNELENFLTEANERRLEPHPVSSSSSKASRGLETALSGFYMDVSTGKTTKALNASKSVIHDEFSTSTDEVQEAYYSCQFPILDFPPDLFPTSNGTTDSPKPPENDDDDQDGNGDGDGGGGGGGDGSGDEKEPPPTPPSSDDDDFLSDMEVIEELDNEAGDKSAALNVPQCGTEVIEKQEGEDKALEMSSDDFEILDELESTEEASNASPRSIELVDQLGNGEEALQASSRNAEVVEETGNTDTGLNSSHVMAAIEVSDKKLDASQDDCGEDQFIDLSIDDEDDEVKILFESISVAKTTDEVEGEDRSKESSSTRNIFEALCQSAVVKVEATPMPGENGDKQRPLDEVDGDKQRPLDEVDGDKQRPLDENGDKQRPLDEVDGDKQRSLDENGDKQRPLDENGDKQRPLDQNGDKQRPLDQNGDKQRPLDENGDKQRPLDENGDKQRPLDQNGDKQRPLDQNGDKQRPLDQNGDKQRPLDQNGDKQRPLDEHGDKQRPLDQNGDKQRPLDEHGDKQRPLDQNGDKPRLQDKADGSRRSTWGSFEAKESVLKREERTRNEMDADEVAAAVSSILPELHFSPAPPTPNNSSVGSVCSSERSHDALFQQLVSVLEKMVELYESGDGRGRGSCPPARLQAMLKESFNIVLGNRQAILPPLSPGVDLQSHVSAALTSFLMSPASEPGPPPSSGSSEHVAGWDLIVSGDAAPALGEEFCVNIDGMERSEEEEAGMEKPVEDSGKSEDPKESTMPAPDKVSDGAASLKSSQGTVNRPGDITAPEQMSQLTEDDELLDELFGSPSGVQSSTEVTTSLTEEKGKGMWSGHHVFLFRSHENAASREAEVLLRRAGASFFDPYHPHLVSPSSRLCILVHADDVARTHLIPNLLQLKNVRRTQFLLFSDPLSCSLGTILFPPAASCVVLDAEVFVTAHPDNLEALVAFLREECMNNRPYRLVLHSQLRNLLDFKLRCRGVAELQLLDRTIQLLTNPRNEGLIEFAGDASHGCRPDPLLFMLMVQCERQRHFRDFFFLSNLDPQSIQAIVFAGRGIVAMTLQEFLINYTTKNYHSGHSRPSLFTESCADMMQEDAPLSWSIDVLPAFNSTVA